MRKHQFASIVLPMAFALICGSTFQPFSSAAADTQAIIGQWGGTLDPGGQPKRQLLVHISQAQDGTLSGTIDYPDQNASGIPITAITYKEPALHFESSSNLSIYDGTMKRDNSQISGTWKQGGTPIHLELKKIP